MKKAVHCAMPVYSSVIMISFVMNCVEVLAHHLPITKTLQSQVIFTSTNFFFEIRHHIAIRDVEAPIHELLPPSSLPLPPLNDVTFACHVFNIFGFADMSKLTSQVK